MFKRLSTELTLIYAALLIGLGWGFVRLPGGFLPVDDQGFITTDVQTPSDSSYARTEAAVEAVERYLLNRSGVEDVTFLTGFSFLGPTAARLEETLTRACEAYRKRPSEWAQIQQTGMLQDWSWDRSARDYVELYRRTLSKVREPQPA